MRHFYCFLLLLAFSTYAKAQGSGNQITFDGSSSYVLADTLKLDSSSITMMTWVKANSFKTRSPYISSLMGVVVPGGDNIQLRLGDANQPADQVQLVILLNGSFVRLNGNIKLSTGSWYHIAATYDGSIMKLYINGVLDNTISASGSVRSRGNFKIGQNPSSSRILDGSMDEISVWRTALSQAEIRDLMCQKINPNHPKYSSLEAYWNFDETSGTAINDVSPNNHTGNFVATPVRSKSDVPLGDTSVTSYSSPFNLSFAHSHGDSLVVSSITGSPSSIHIYRVNEKPNVTTMPGGGNTIDTTRYWGVFYAGGSSPSGTVNYYSANNAMQNHVRKFCSHNLAKRGNNASSTWSQASATVSSNNYSMTNQSRSEYILFSSFDDKIHAQDTLFACNGDSIVLEHSSSSSTYTWYHNNAQIQNASANRYTATQAGSYWLAVSNGGCNDTTNTFYYALKSLPSVSLNITGVSCDRDSSRALTGGIPMGGQYSGNFVTSGMFSPNSAGIGNHDIYYTVVDSQGCTNTDTSTLTVIAPQVVLSPINSMCLDTISFTVSNGTPAGGTYFINGQRGSIFTSMLLGAGSQQVVYHYTDSNGCFNADTLTVNVKALPNVSLNITLEKACEYEDSKILDGQSPAAGGTFSGAGVSGRSFDPAVAGPGKHPITYTYMDAQTQCDNEAVDSIEIIARPVKPVITSQQGTFTSTAADKYFWYDLTQRFINDTLQQFTPGEAGNYYVVVQTNGCTSLPSDTIEFNPSIGFGEFNKLVRVKLYPNPSHDVLHVSIAGSNELYTVKLMNLSGQVVVESAVQNQTSIDVSALDAGNYILQLSGNNEISQQRIIIAH